MIIVRLKPKEHHRITAGHLWVYRDEIVGSPDAGMGEVVTVTTNDGIELGTGFYNPHSKIAVRLHGVRVTSSEYRVASGSEASSDSAMQEYFNERIRLAYEMRQRVMPGEEAYRVVFGESDLLSGLIVDKFNSTVVIQMLAAGMDLRKDMIVEAIRNVMPDVTGIIERNTAQTRKKEGLELRDGIVWGSVPEFVEFKENGIQYSIDLLNGQKTGYFLDQKLNRATVASLVTGNSNVLDCFCNVGGFALNAGFRGQGTGDGRGRVVGVDSSAWAIQAAKRHAEINILPNVEFVQANVFDFLREQVNLNAERRTDNSESGTGHMARGTGHGAHGTWDVIILDPPSFAKTRSAIGGARAGYAELTRLGLKALAPDGILVSSSCTQLISDLELLDIIYREAARLRLRLRLLHRSGQAPDHPVLLAMPETSYLKFFVFDVLGET